MRWLAVALLISCTPAPPPAPKTFSVRDGFIRDPEGRAVILRGVNVSGKHKGPPYFDFHGAPDFARLRDVWGFNAVRFLVSWSAIEPRRGEYDANYLAELKRRVSLATDAGLLVFIDMHQDLYGEGFVGANGAPRWTCDESNYAAYRPVTPWFLNALSAQVIACVDGFWSSADLKSRYVQAWRQVAIALKDDPGVIGVDPMNEPPWGSMPNDVFEKTRLAPLYREVLAQVRAERPDWIGFLEPAASRNLGLPTALPRFTEPNLVYAPHAYDPDAERGLGFKPERRAAILENAKALKSEADALGAALVIGEFGGNASHSGIVEYMDAQYASHGAVAAGAMYWEDTREDDGYGLEQADGGLKPALERGVVRPFPERVAGTPGAYAFDDATQTLTFSFEADAPPRSVTVLSLPASWRGLDVTCTGCLWTRDARPVVFVTTIVGASTVVISLRRLPE